LCLAVLRDFVDRRRVRLVVVRRAAPAVVERLEGLRRAADLGEQG
jgi:hypothetical protein